MEGADAGRDALRTVWHTALSTDDLTDAGLTVEESGALNRLLLKVIRATDGARPAEGDELWRMPGG